MKKWRLTNDSLTALVVTNERKVYLVPEDKASYKFELLKKLSDCSIYTSEIEVNNKFYLKITNNLKVLAKSESFPENEYYEVANFDISEIGEIITQVENNKGEFTDSFEAAFLTGFSYCKVFFINKDMSQYKECFFEMRRFISYDMKKKTKEWKVGYRYDTQTDSVYYLGKIEFTGNVDGIINDDTTKTYYLVSSDIDENYKKISEVLKNGIFNNNLKVISSLSLRAEGDQKLENDVINFQDYWEDILKNTKKYNKSSDNNRISRYLNINNILSVLFYQTGLEKVSLSEESIDTIIDVLKPHIEEVFIKNWNKKISGIKLSSSASTSENIDNLIKLSIMGFDGGKEGTAVFKYEIYKELFNRLSIPIKDIAKSVIISLGNKDYILGNFNNYVKYYDISDNYQDSQSCLRYNKDTFTGNLSEVIGDGILYKTIKELFKRSRDKCGLGISYFCHNPSLSKKKPGSIDSLITVKDIIKYYGGIDKVPDSLKSEICEKKFLRIRLFINDNEELE